MCQCISSILPEFYDNAQFARASINLVILQPQHTKRIGRKNHTSFPPGVTADANTEGYTNNHGPKNTHKLFVALQSERTSDVAANTRAPAASLNATIDHISTNTPTMLYVP